MHVCSGSPVAGAAIDACLFHVCRAVLTMMLEQGAARMASLPASPAEQAKHLTSALTSAPCLPTCGSPGHHRAAMASPAGPLLGARNWGALAKELDALLVAQPASPQLLLNRALCYHQLGLLRKALKASEARLGVESHLPAIAACRPTHMALGLRRVPAMRRQGAASTPVACRRIAAAAACSVCRLACPTDRPSLPITPSLFQLNRTMRQCSQKLQRTRPRCSARPRRMWR